MNQKHSPIKRVLLKFRGGDVKMQHLLPSFCNFMDEILSKTQLYLISTKLVEI
jgi:hypothetical protein